MNKVIVTSIFLLFFVTAFGTDESYYIDSTQIDTQAVTIRHIDDNFTKEYTNKKAFDYGSKRFNLNETFIEKLTKWISRIISRFFDSYSGLATGFKLMVWLIAIAFLVFAIIKTRLKNIFYNIPENDSMPYKVVDTEDENINWTEAIITAEQQSNYRLAIRYNFLYALEILGSKQLIERASEKTNYDYMLDLRKQNSNLFPVFRDVMGVYNAVWYGHHSINEEIYKQHIEKFRVLNGSDDV